MHLDDDTDSDAYLESIRKQLKDLWISTSLAGVDRAMQVTDVFYYKGEVFARLEVDEFAKFMMADRIVDYHGGAKTRAAAEEAIAARERRIAEVANRRSSAASENLAESSPAAAAA